MASKAARQEPSVKDITLDSAPQGEKAMCPLGKDAPRTTRLMHERIEIPLSTKHFRKRAFRIETRPWRPLRGNAADSKPASRELRRRLGMPELQSSRNDG